MKNLICDDGLFQGSFDDFLLPIAIRKGITQAGYERPTLVQNKTFTPVHSGRDVVVRSPTGSGKTAAFLLPLAAKLEIEAPTDQDVPKDKEDDQASPLRDSQDNGDAVVPAVLILAPTRELAGQICSECQKLGHYANLKILAVYGGASLEKQVEALRQGVHIVVATPGRLKDLMQRGAFKPASIRHCVLDEADEMLSKGFWDDVLHILDALPRQRQLLLFSATLPEQIRKACSYLMREPIHVDLSQENTTPADVTHVFYMENDAWPKPRNLLYMLELAGASQGIIFCNRRDETELLERYLSNFSYRACALNGDMSQRVREKALESIRSGKFDFLVATDVAARGIDISRLSHVFNYGMPESEEVYVHRTGRTGRMGRKGAAVNLIRRKDLAYVDRLKESFDLSVTQNQFPPEQEILAQQSSRVLEVLETQAKHVECGQYLPLATAMLGKDQAAQALAFLLRSYHASKSSPLASFSQAPDQADFSPRDDRRRSGSRTMSSVPSRSRQGDGASRDSRSSTQTETRPPPRGQRRELSSEQSTQAVDAGNDRTSRPQPLAHTPTRLYINLGKDNGFADLVSLAYAMSEYSGVDLGKFTGVGNMREQSSHVEVDTDCAQKVMTELNGRSHNDKTITCQLAHSVRASGASSSYGRDRRGFRGRPQRGGQN